MVNAKIYKNKPLEECNADLKVAANKSLISCEVQDLAGQLVCADPVLIVDIRSRKGADGGAEYCAEIADAVRALLDDGFTGAEVTKLRGEVRFDKSLVAYRCRLEVYCHIKVSYTLTLTPSITGPQVAGTEIVFTANASPADGLEYRFFVTGPGTGAKARDMTGWISRNNFSWRSSSQDVGTSTITVQVRGGKSQSTADQTTTASYTITAASGGSGAGSLPTITSLTPTLASPKPAETKIDFICIAADADNDPIYYRFYLTGPGTASKKKIVQDWSLRNAWSWTPQAVDVGASTRTVEIRDGNHAGPGGYDATTTASFTVTTASAGTGSLPTITSLTPTLASPRAAETEMDIICIAADADNDPIYYRFYLTGPGTASKKKIVQDWSLKNSWHWKPLAVDVGSNTIAVEIRDGNHAGPGSYDATTGISYTITAASVGTGSLPTITSLTPTLASPRGQGTEIEFICIATDADNDPIYYRFYLTGPGTASKKKMVQDWSLKNSWKWTAAKEDIGANTITVEIRDGNHAGQGSYDATTSASYTISSNTAPTINEVYYRESSNLCVGDKMHFVAKASDADGDLILYKFFRSSNERIWEALTGWQPENWILYEIDKTDYGGTLFIKAQVRDGKHAGEESFDAEIEVDGLPVDRASLTSVTPSLASPKAHETTIVFSALANKTTKIYYRFWQKGPGTGNVWRDMTGWQAKNSWSWRTLACDIGTNYVRVEVCDDPDTWDDNDTSSRRIDTTYTIS